MKKIMAVYDSDPLYAERLSDYVNRRDQGMFQAQAFTSKERLEEYARENEIDILLTGESEDAAGFEEIAAGKHIRLSEERKKEEGGKKEIYKYQSGDDIIREVMACYGEMSGAESAFGDYGGNEKRLIGIYSPIGRCGKTSLAFSMGQILAREEKVLFVSLDEFTGFSGLMHERWKRDLSDLIYYYKQGRFSSVRLNSVLYFIGDMAWLPPLKFPEDYCQITAGEMAGLFKEILKSSDFKTLVLDMGNFGRQVLPLLEICQVVYMPTKEDVVSQAKVREFGEYLEAVGKGELEARMKKVHVPLSVGTKRMEHFPQELIWGELGDFVRSILKGPRGLWES